MQEQQQGYGSDGSETLSIHSAQSMPARQSSRRMTNGENEQVSVNHQQLDDNVEEYIEEGAISDSVMTKGNITISAKDRKKSLMTRLIPGRNAPVEGKRTGFQRSEEVGIPEGLTIPGDYLQSPFTKQTSKESSESAYSDQLVYLLILYFIYSIKYKLNFDIMNLKNKKNKKQYGLSRKWKTKSNIQ
ncbi:unnamed protein product [Onchocerca flexuosa]|uniref:Uncharacterized protein n=1 Tax=Onchocerca flexuosa TaxID=387005 RepID=A0A183HQF1_9BILA|nr:unnamed protein product [Onchocerca flexuosa]